MNKFKNAIIIFAVAFCFIGTCETLVQAAETSKNQEYEFEKSVNVVKSFQGKNYKYEYYEEKTFGGPELLVATLEGTVIFEVNQLGERVQSYTDPKLTKYDPSLEYKVEVEIHNGNPAYCTIVLKTRSIPNGYIWNNHINNLYYWD